MRPAILLRQHLNARNRAEMVIGIHFYVDKFNRCIIFTRLVINVLTCVEVNSFSLEFKMVINCALQRFLLVADGRFCVKEVPALLTGIKSPLSKNFPISALNRFIMPDSKGN